MNDAQRQGIIIAVALLVLIGLGTAAGEYAKKQPHPSQSPGLSFTTEKTVSYTGKNDRTVLELLQENHKVDTQESDGGLLVTSIDGVAQRSGADSSSSNGAPGQTAIWIYYLNGQPGTEAADKAKTQDGQTIEWRLVSF